MARAPVASVAPTAMEPSAPALETAAAMAGVETPAMGAWTMGWDRPSDSMIDMGRLSELCGRRAMGRIRTGYPASAFRWRSEEQTSELPPLMRISYAVICLKKKK